MRFFNTTGPVVAADHYRIPPLERLNFVEVRRLIRDKRYFVLHAPRQTGKTSALLALRDLLNAEDTYRCVYVNVEAGQAAREDVEQVTRTFLGELAVRASLTLNDEFLLNIWSGILAEFGPHAALRVALTRWAQADSKPLVLLIDEIDALIGDALLSVLRQLRAGYDLRPEGFPQSVILCGVRDVRDYRIQSTAENALIAGGSAFNIRAESLRLGDFSQDEVFALISQHTAETGQAFTAEALETIWTQTQGQPWLVNALAYEACFKNKTGQDRSQPITDKAIYDAREQLILRREIHLDQLADKLKEDRVRRVVEPLLSGGEERRFIDRDIEYVRDLGLVAQERPVRIANPIYAEVVPRELTWVVQEEFEQETAWYVTADGSLDVVALLTEFQTFFREHSEHWVTRFQYQEAGPQLLLQAFLQRVVNSGGRIEREYGLGRMRTDLLIVWPQGDQTRKIVIECKLLHKSLDQTIAEGLEQTAEYMDRCDAEAGHLVIFDRRAGRRWEDKVFHRRRASEGGVEIDVWGM
ncbi:ATP-binding protein [Candidatus Poribacteria bacterium]|nr:ATP-binding protein [Candidatus Poribacteria bacterium]MYF38274.1 ATP-binding protein [Gammaproteobacteria bacterium]